MKVDWGRKDNIFQVFITGSVKTIDETREAREVLDDIVQKNNAPQIEIYLKEVDVITSSLIGVLIKMIYGENIKMSVITDSNKLYTLLDRLNLVSTLNIRMAA